MDQEAAAASMTDGNLPTQRIDLPLLQITSSEGSEEI